MNKEKIYIKPDENFMNMLKFNNKLQENCVDIENTERTIIIGNTLLVPTSLIASISSIPMFLNSDAKSAIMCAGISIASLTICSGINIITNKRLKSLHNEKEKNLVLKMQNQKYH